MVSEDLRNMSMAGTEKIWDASEVLHLWKTEEVLKRNEHCKKDSGASLRGSWWDMLINTNISVLDKNLLNKKLFFTIECYRVGKINHQSATTIVIIDLNKSH